MESPDGGGRATKSGSSASWAAGSRCGRPGLPTAPGLPEDFFCHRLDALVAGRSFLWEVSADGQGFVVTRSLPQPYPVTATTAR